MSTKNNKKKLPPFEQSKENLKIFRENLNLYESALLLVEAAAALNIVGEEDSEMKELNDMLKVTIRQFSEFLEERGDEWN